MRPRKTGPRAGKGRPSPAATRHPLFSPEEQAEYAAAGDLDAEWFLRRPIKWWRLRLAVPAEQKLLPPGEFLIHIEQLMPGASPDYS